jgi:hypothetical protein
MSIQIIDNFLDADVFQKVKSVIYGPDFAWYHNEFIVSPDKDDQTNLFNWQLTHTFYKELSIRSNHFIDIDPILRKLNPSAVVKIKANLMPKSDQIIVHKFHIDVTKFRGKTSVFYINSNDGFTLFEDGTRVESVENRMVIFDSDRLHTGTSCTNARNRCVINFNYYEWN